MPIDANALMTTVNSNFITVDTGTPSALVSQSKLDQLFATVAKDPFEWK